jgi:ABC-2 type transport system ATP-binding protein
VHDPRLLILDEPTNGMDPQGRVEIIELARDLSHNKGMSVLFSSHLLPDVEAVCDYVVVLGGGRVLAQGLIQDLKQAHEHVVEVRVKSGRDRFAASLLHAGCAAEPVDDRLLVRLPAGQSEKLVWEAARANGQQIRFLRPRRSTLEEVFLEAVAEPD